jgi:hypothetical protein
MIVRSLISILALLTACGFGFCQAAVLPTTAWPKSGNNWQNQHKSNVDGPANPSLLVRWIGIGGTDAPTTDGGDFYVPQGPLLIDYSPAGFASLLINTTPGNVSTLTNFDKILVELKDTTGLICDPMVNCGTCSYPPVPPPLGTDPNGFYIGAQGWAGYGKFYISVPFFRITLVFAGGGWRSIAPIAIPINSINAIADPNCTTPKPVKVTGFLFVDIFGDVSLQYIHMNWDGTTLKSSFRSYWGGGTLPTMPTFTTMYTSATPAISTSGTELFLAGHYGVVTDFTIASGAITWQLGFEESFDGPIALNGTGDLLIGTSQNATTGRIGNKLYKVPKNGNSANVVNVALNGSIVGGPAVNTTVSSCYVVTLGVSGSTLYKINSTTLAIQASRSDLGQLRTTPIIDKSGNLYIGNEQGFLYSLDSNLNVRANYPIFVGGSIHSPCSFNDDGQLIVVSGKSTSIYMQGSRPGNPMTGQIKTSPIKK